jgi:hypothetical protein
MYEVQTGVILKEQVVQEKEAEQSRITELLLPKWVKRPTGCATRSKQASKKDE